MGKNKSFGATTRPTTGCDLRTTPGQVAKLGLPKEMDVADSQDPDRQRPQGTTEPLSTETEDENSQNLEFSQEDEFAMEEVRLELFRRKELALIEMQKMVAEASRKPNVKS